MIVRYETDGSIVMITQNDHAQLSGLFAAHWGNEEFEKPRPYGSLVRAAMFHDRGWIRYERVRSSIRKAAKRRTIGRFRAIAPSSKRLNGRATGCPQSTPMRV
jgi:hypothetical protein